MKNQERDQCNCAQRLVTRHVWGVLGAMSVLVATGGAAASAGGGGGPAVSAAPDAAFLPGAGSAPTDGTWVDLTRRWLQLIHDLIDSGAPLCGEVNGAIGQVCDEFAERGWPAEMTLVQVVQARAAIVNLRTLMEAPDLTAVDSAHVAQMKSTLTTMERALPMRME